MTRKNNIATELNLIQTQIQRMANNSFIIKGWYITFLSTFGIYVITQNKLNLIGWGALPIVVCSLYDSYFLQLEKLYREKYNWVITNIDINDHLFDLNPTNINMQIEQITYFDALFSKLIICLYFLPLFLFIVIA